MSVITQVLMLFIVILIGTFCRKKNYFTPEVVRGVTQIIVNISLPCLTISTMQRPFAAEEFHNFLYILALSVLLVLLSVAICLPIYRKHRHERRAVLINFAIFCNSSFMGYPIIMAINPDWMIYAISYNVAFTFFTWTLGNGLFGSKENMNLTKLLINPNIIAAAIGFCLFCAGISLPALAMDVMELVGGLTTPLAMLLIGTRLYGVRMSDFKDMDYHICAFLRLIAIPLALYGVLTLMHVPLAVRNTMFLVTAMPNSTMVVNQAELYGGDHVFAARAVAYTTLLSLLSVPVMSLLL